MGVRLNPYLHFDGQAAAALAFYGDAFGAAPTMMKFSEMGVEGPDADKVMHGQLDTGDDLTLMCSDFPSSMTLTSGNAVTASLSGDDGARLRGLFEALSAGGEIETPLEKQMWGDEFGAFTDRFGVHWLVNITGG